MDASAPTKEWLGKFYHQTPGTDQKTDSRAYRRLSLAEETLKRGDITREQFDASERLHRIFHGANGADVRSDFGGTPYDPDYPAQEAMASDLAHARAVIRLKPMWDALEMFAIEEQPLTAIGRMIRRGVKDHKIARAAGLTVVSIGLDLLADTWGISQHQRSRDRRAA